MYAILRAILIIALLVVLILGGVWLAGQSGSVSIDVPESFPGTISGLEMPLVLFVGGLLVVCLLLYIVFRVIGGLLSLPKVMRRKHHLRKQHELMDTVRSSLLAMASGDDKTALSHARKAEKLADNPDIGLLLGAQASSHASDTLTARQYYTRLQHREDTAFVGTRGLMYLAQQRGDNAEAYALAKQAWEQHPDKPGMAETMLELHLAHQQWQPALALLPDIQRYASWPVDKLRRTKAEIRTAEAFTLLEQHRTDDARSAASEASSLQQAFAPAWQALATALLQQGKSDRAAAMVLKGYRKSGSDALLLAVPDLFAKEPPAVFHRLASKLARAAGDKPLSLYVLAVAEDAVGMKKNALSHLETITATLPVQEVMKRLAALYQHRDNSEEATYWLTRADAAPTLPEWMCSSCNARQTRWHLTCPACHAIGSAVFNTRRNTEDSITLATTGKQRLLSANN